MAYQMAPTPVTATVADDIIVLNSRVRYIADADDIVVEIVFVIIRC